MQQLDMLKRRSRLLDQRIKNNQTRIFAPSAADWLSESSAESTTKVFMQNVSNVQLVETHLKMLVTWT